MREHSEPVLVTRYWRGRRNPNFIFVQRDGVTRREKPKANTERAKISAAQRGAVVLALRGGSTQCAAAEYAGMHRATLYRLMDRVPGFRREVEDAECEGAKVRDYRRWLEHPFRGRRPPKPEGRRGGYPIPRFPR